MNSKLKYLVITVLFAGVFAAAVIGYNALSKVYTPPAQELSLPGSTASLKKEEEAAGNAESVPADSAEPEEVPEEVPVEKAEEPEEELEEVTEEIPEETPEEVPEEEPEAVPAPDFTIMALDGSMVSLSDRLEEGKPIVLNFWATWCGPCTSELPAFNKAVADYADEITFMMINLTDGQVDTVSGVREFLTENDYSLPVYFDKKWSAAGPYGASSIPLTYFITSDGMVVGGHSGSMSEETLYNYLEQLLGLEG